MKTTRSRIASLALPGLFAVLVIFAATAEAGGNGAPRSARPVATTGIGESLRSQLDGADYQFAIAAGGRLELTGSNGHPSPAAAIAELTTGRLGGNATTCHLRFDNGVEAVVIVTNPSSALPQPCGILGEAMEAVAGPRPRSA